MVLQRSLQLINEFQAIAMQRGYTDRPSGLMESTGLNNIPAVTELNVGIALLKSGLEGNRKALQENIARVDLLGESSLEFATSIRDFSLGFMLRGQDQANFVDVLADSAKTYKASTTELAKALNSLAKLFASQVLTGNTIAQEALVDVLARTDRAAPGGLQSVLSLVIGGLDKVAVNQMLGTASLVESFNASKTTGDRSQAINSLEGIVSQISARTEEFTTMFPDPEIFKTMVTALIGPGADQQLLIATNLERILEGNLTASELQQAKLADVEKVLKTMGDRLLEPIGMLSQSVLIILDFLGPITKYIVSGAIILAFAKVYAYFTTLLTHTASIVQLLTKIAGSSVIPQAPGFGQKMRRMSAKFQARGRRIARAGFGLPALGNMLKSGFGSVIGGIGALFNPMAMGLSIGPAIGRGLISAFRFVLGGLFSPIGAIITLLSFLPMIFGSSEETANSTKRIANRDAVRPNIDDSRFLLTSQAQLISRLNEPAMAGSLAGKADSEDLAQALRERTVDRLDNVVKAIEALALQRETKNFLDRARGG